MKKISAKTVFMVEPTTFGFDEQTAVTNAFQHRVDQEQTQIAAAAQVEFDKSVAKLRQHNIEVITFKDHAKPTKPNAVFPNNWLATLPDGRVFLYPMATPSRRAERSQAVVDMLHDKFNIKETIDLSSSELQDKYLEGTGAIVFDHANKIAYGCISARCDKELFTDHVKSLGYQPFAFYAYDQNDVPIYHTNVVVAVQTTTAVICSEAVKDANKRHEIIDLLKQTGHDVIDITQEQLNNYCANVIEVQNGAGKSFLILSQTAYNSFTPSERKRLEADKTLLPIDIPTIEQVGGGSARCMVAEVFLPPKNQTT